MLLLLLIFLFVSSVSQIHHFIILCDMSRRPPFQIPVPEGNLYLLVTQPSYKGFIEDFLQNPMFLHPTKGWINITWLEAIRDVTDKT